MVARLSRCCEQGSIRGHVPACFALAFVSLPLREFVWGAPCCLLACLLAARCPPHPPTYLRKLDTLAQGQARVPLASPRRPPRPAWRMMAELADDCTPASVFPLVSANGRVQRTSTEAPCQA